MDTITEENEWDLTGGEVKAPTSTFSVIEDRRHWDILERRYYQNIFPVSCIAEGFRSPLVDGLLKKREFAIQLPNNIWKRNIYVKDEEGLKAVVSSQHISNLQIGATYKYLRPDSGPEEKIFEGKELCFDIDMSDYKPYIVTEHCDPLHVDFEKSWKFMYFAVTIIDTTLRSDFALKDILFVFSGRRGIHVWVTDMKTYKLSGEQRSMMMKYMDVHGSDNPNVTESYLDTWKWNYPQVRKMVELITNEKNYPIFLEIAEEQGWFHPDRMQDTILSPIRNEEKRTACIREIKRKQSTLRTFTAENAMRCLKTMIETPHGKRDKWLFDNDREQFDSRASALWNQVICKAVWPRFDKAVTTGETHLLKSPFSIHPKTHFVCVPFNPNKALKFRDVRAMTVQELITPAREGEEIQVNHEWKKAFFKQIKAFERVLILSRSRNREYKRYDF